MRRLRRLAAASYQIGFAPTSRLPPYFVRERLIQAAAIGGASVTCPRSTWYTWWAASTQAD